MLCVACGEVSEGTDFDHHYGWTVFCVGRPSSWLALTINNYLQYTRASSRFAQSRILKVLLKFLHENYRIQENYFLSFHTTSHTAQFLGRVLHKRDDYGIRLLADRRLGKKGSEVNCPSGSSKPSWSRTSTYRRMRQSESQRPFLRGMG